MSNNNNNNTATIDLSVYDTPLFEQVDTVVSELNTPFAHRFAQPIIDGQPITTTYSSWAKFRNCRKAFELRYFCGLIPLREESQALTFGTIIHHCLARWFENYDDCATLRLLDGSFPDRFTNPETLQSWHYARAMVLGYMRRYGNDTNEFTVRAIEEPFTNLPIVNPKTGATSRTFVMAGKIDLLVELPSGEYWIFDHKTASSINDGYLERLWCDLQLQIYARYYSRAAQIPITGCVYDIMVKPKLKQSTGETEEEFAIRYAEACAKNKSGKSSATRKLPETDAEFQARLTEKMDDPYSYYREWIPLDDRRLTSIESEIWELSQQLLIARRTRTFYQNTDTCFKYGSPCAYFPICKSGMNEVVAANQYRIESPHAELTGDETNNVSEEI